MTTAELRNAAQQAEKELRWHDAWTLWIDAIKAYPTTGTLAATDKRRMTERAMSCKEMLET